MTIRQTMEQTTTHSPVTLPALTLNLILGLTLLLSLSLTLAACGTDTQEPPRTALPTSAETALEKARAVDQLVQDTAQQQRDAIDEQSQ